MNREQIEHALKPLWQGFAASIARLEEALEQSRTEPVDRMNALDRLRHESDLQQSIAYLRYRERAFLGDGFYQALDTGRGILTWPNVYPSQEAAALAVAEWREARAKKRKNIQPLRREA